MVQGSEHLTLLLELPLLSHSAALDRPTEDIFSGEFSADKQLCREEEFVQFEEESVNRPEVLSAGALNVINRVSNKLTGILGVALSITLVGRDFSSLPLDVPAQVDKLVREAVSVQNLCQAYVGWCPFW